MASIIGVTLAKVNNLFRVDVTNATWDVKRPVNQVPTGGGVKIGTSTLYLVSGTFDEIVPITSQFNWFALSNWSVQIYDQATRKIQLFSAQNCEWEDLGGASNVAQATTTKKIAWKGELVLKV